MKKAKVRCATLRGLDETVLVDAYELPRGWHVIIPTKEPIAYSDLYTIIDDDARTMGSFTPVVAHAVVKMLKVALS